MANSGPGLGLNLGAPVGASRVASPRPSAPAAIGVTPASPIEPPQPSPTAGPSKSSSRWSLRPLQTQLDAQRYDQKHHSIPPPPSPRRHRAVMSRGGRGNSAGGISTSKSWADLSGMGAATAPLRSPSLKDDRRAVSEHHRVFSHGDLTDEPWDEPPYDNR